MNFEAKSTHFGGSPLNRLSWLRPSHNFLNGIVHSSNTRWIIFNGGQPLISTVASKKTLAQISTTTIQSLLGPLPYFGQYEKPNDSIPESAVQDPSLESARHLPGADKAPVVFLGLLETNVEVDDQDGSRALPSSSFSGADPAAAIANIEGIPFFAIDVGKLDQDLVKNVFSTTEFGALEFIDARAAMTNKVLDHLWAAVYAEARSMLDWNFRNTHCAACGTKTYALWGGWKINCRTLLPWVGVDAEGNTCITAKGLHNFTHPRTDPVVIMLVIDESGERILLGKSKKFPGKFYSALAGFVEPAESFEDAVKRELWEEAGIKTHGVTYYASQPWPYPANLMVGYYARAHSSQIIRTDLDNELADAQWFTREEVLAILKHPDGTNMTGRDHRKLAAIQTEGSNTAAKITAFVDEDGPDGRDSDAAAKAANHAVRLAPGVILKDSDEPPFRVPPTTAIAGVLIRDWAEGKATNVAPFEDTTVTLKGNL